MRKSWYLALTNGTVFAKLAAMNSKPSFTVGEVCELTGAPLTTMYSRIGEAPVRLRPKKGPAGTMLFDRQDLPAFLRWLSRDCGVREGWLCPQCSERVTEPGKQWCRECLTYHGHARARDTEIRGKSAYQKRVDAIYQIREILVKLKTLDEANPQDGPEFRRLAVGLGDARRHLDRIAADLGAPKKALAGNPDDEDDEADDDPW